MIIGHYAAALVPHARRVGLPLVVLLFVANLADFLWVALAILGPERPDPGSMWEASLSGLEVDMHWSHDLVPTLGLALATGLVLGLWTRKPRAGAWAAGLVVAHLACDLLSGYQHHVLGSDTPCLGLDLYHRSPRAALLLEAAFGVLCVSVYLRERRRSGRPIGRRGAALLYATFVVGTLLWIPSATTPLGELLGR